MTHLGARLDLLLEKRRRQGRFRRFSEYDTTPSSGLVDFSSNDYLSLTTSPLLRRKYLDNLASSPHILGSTGSRLLSGCTPWHSSLESRFSKFFNAPSSLLFNSGWDANVSFFSTVPQHGDWVIYDALVHASVHDGMRASRLAFERRVAFEHNDPESLRRVLKKLGKTKGDGTIFLALESLYSMDGDFARLGELLDVLDEHVSRERQCVVLDEAHSTAVYGEKGRGLAYALGEEGGWEGGQVALTPRGKGRVGVRLMTFGKATGCSGAVLLCSPMIRTFLINFARPLIFSTALPHSTLISLHSAWDLISSSEGDRLRAALLDLISRLQASLERLLANTSPSVLRLPERTLVSVQTTVIAAIVSPILRAHPASPIFGLCTPEPHALSAFLLDKGFIVRPVVPPTVPPGGERVRICLRAEMDRSVLDRLVRALEEWVDLKTAKSPPREGAQRHMAIDQAAVLRAKL